MLSVFLALAVLQDGQANEAVLREEFARGFQDRSPAKRVEAVRKLNALHEEKTLLALAGALKDPVVDVRRAAADIIATCTDVSGAAIKGLCATLLNRKEDRSVRVACAKALGTAQYKAEAIDALVQTLSVVPEGTASLRYLSAQEFKGDADAWKKWWNENKPRIVKEDAEKLAAYRKSVVVKGK